LISIDFGKMKKVLLKHNIMQSKMTVEQTLDVSIDEITRKMKSHRTSSGKFAWELGEWKDAELLWVYRIRSGQPSIEFRFRYDTEPSVEQRIELLKSNTNFGGQRLWFKCPADIKGQPCARRVGKLYIPPGAKYMACRHCYCLTYQSSQEAGYHDRLAKALAKHWGISPELAKELGELNGWQ